MTDVSDLADVRGRHIRYSFPQKTTQQAANISPVFRSPVLLTTINT